MNEVVSTSWVIFIIVAVLWSIPWKIAGLWRSAQNGDKVWFGVLFFINTLGFLEILYLFFFNKKSKVLDHN
jgi:methionyl-tRNA synthetase